MPYSNVEPDLQEVAEAAKIFLQRRYNLKKPIIDKEISSEIKWRPTFYWLTKLGYIACEVSSRPFRPIIEIAFSCITSMGLPVTIFIAYPDVPQIPLKDFNADIKKAKQYGVGLISISENHEGAIQYHGMPVNLFLSAPDFNRFKQPIRPGVMSAYEDFTDGNPDGGVQKLGQLVESAIVNLAIQARNKGTYKKGGFVEGKYYPQGNLIDELMHERIIDNGVLGRCRGFCDDRGSVSHKPRDLKEAIRIQKSLKECFLLGLRILEELPAFLIKKGYRFRT